MTRIIITETEEFILEDAVAEKATAVLAHNNMTLGEGLNAFLQFIRETGKLPCEIAAYVDPAGSFSKYPTVPPFDTLFRVDAKQFMTNTAFCMATARGDSVLCIESGGKPDLVLLTAAYYADVIYPASLIEDWGL